MAFLKTGRALVLTTAVVAAVSLSTAPGVAYADWGGGHGGGGWHGRGGGWHGGGGWGRGYGGGWGRGYGGGYYPYSYGY